MVATWGNVSNSDNKSGITSVGSAAKDSEDAKLKSTQGGDSKTEAGNSAKRAKTKKGKSSKLSLIHI